MSRRVKVQYASGETVLGSKLMQVPGSTDEFFDLVRAKFGIPPEDQLQMRADDADVDDIDIIRDDDTVVVSRLGDIAKRGSLSAAFNPAASAFALYPPATFSTSMFDTFGGLTGYGDMSGSRLSLQGGRLVPKKKRYRRSHQELSREHKCTIEGCGRMYASENSLVQLSHEYLFVIQHIRIKHPQYAGQVSKRGRKSAGTDSQGEDGAVFSEAQSGAEEGYHYVTEGELKAEGTVGENGEENGHGEVGVGEEGGEGEGGEAEGEGEGDGGEHGEGEQGEGVGVDDGQVEMDGYAHVEYADAPVDQP